MHTGLLNTSQNLGGAIGTAVASSIVASHLRALTQHGTGAGMALTDGLHLAIWVSGLAGLAALDSSTGGRSLFWRPLCRQNSHNRRQNSDGSSIFSVSLDCADAGLTQVSPP